MNWGRMPAMRKFTFRCVALAAACLATAAHAQNSGSGSGKTAYKWVDDKGVIHYGDSVPAEYSQREQRQLNSQGVEVGRKQAEMTPAEAAAHAAKQKEELARKNHDLFLMSTASRIAVPAVMTSSTMTTRPFSGLPTMLPPSP